MSAKRWWWALVAAALLAVGGCGDSNVFEGQAKEEGYQAELEKGLRALKASDWTEAIRVFDALDLATPSAETRRYLSSAYAGRAGFDSLTLVEAIADAQDEEDTSEDSVLYDTVARMFAEENGKLPKAVLDDKVADLNQAVRVATNVHRAAPRAVARVSVATPATLAAMTRNEIFQAGLYSAVHAVLSIADQLVEGDLRVLNLDRVTTAMIGVVVAPATLNRDLDWVNAAKDSLIAGLAGDLDSEDQNDIAEEFRVFLEDLGYLDDDPEALFVSTDELRAYLLSILP